MQTSVLNSADRPAPGEQKRVSHVTREARVSRFALCVTLLCWLFVIPLAKLVQYAVDNDLFSYVFLIPFIAGYLFFAQRQALSRDFRCSRAMSTVLFCIGVLPVVGMLSASAMGLVLSAGDSVSVTTFSLVTLLVATAYLFLGDAFVRSAIFPTLFLYFAVPLPDLLTHWTAVGLQHATAGVLELLFSLARMPQMRDGLTFHLPGLTLLVAEECSGIRSTLVLLMTGLICSHLFLKTPWRKALLVACFLPIGAFRNAFRILVIAQLTIRVDPEIINGPIHRRGGPVFFVLSLIPLFMAMLLLRWSERRKHRQPAKLEAVA